MDFWLYLGLETVLGAPVDRAIDGWEELFIPARLADAVSAMPGVKPGRPLVSEDRVLFESPLPAPPATPPVVWPRYLLTSLVLLLTAGLLGRYLPPAALGRAWFLLSGLAGLALVFFWFGTDHAAAHWNFNVLVLNPLWLLLVPRRPAARYALPVVGAFAALAQLMPWLPPGQSTADVLAAALPLNLAAAWSVNRAVGRRGRP